jgi:hypothetical protein
MTSICAQAPLAENANPRKSEPILMLHLLSRLLCPNAWR